VTRKLTTVARTAQRRTKADQAYLAAILDARDTHSLAEIGRAAGVTRQAVAQLVNRHTTPKEGQ